MPQHDLGSGPKGEEKPQDGGIHEQGDNGRHDEVGNETIDGKGAEMVGNKGCREEGARDSHHNERDEITNHSHQQRYVWHRFFC